MAKIDIDSGYFDQPKTKKLLWRLLWAVCIISLLLDLFIHPHHHFYVEKIPGFYSLLGFVACAAAILIAKGLGSFLKKKENYYDDAE